MPGAFDVFGNEALLAKGGARRKDRRIRETRRIRSLLPETVASRYDAPRDASCRAVCSARGGDVEIAEVEARGPQALRDRSAHETEADDADRGSGHARIVDGAGRGGNFEGGGGHGCSCDAPVAGSARGTPHRAVGACEG